MRIRLLFGTQEGCGDAPWLLSAVDEYTEDNWNGLPDWYMETMTEHEGPLRQCFIDIPDSQVQALFAIPTVMSSSVKPVEGGNERDQKESRNG